MASVADARNTLLSGADKAGTNTGAVENPSLITSLVETIGRQCVAVVVAIDAKKNRAMLPNGTAFSDGRGPFWYEVHTYGGKRAAGLDAVQWAREAVRRGAGEILLTSIDSDGTKRGYDTTLTGAVADAVSVPVIASGGCGEPLHMARAFEETAAGAALAASIFHYDERAIWSVKEFLDGRGIPVRL